MPETRAQYYPLGGGLDVVTPALSVDPGRALTMVNFEPWFNGGYRRIPGFERFDGRPKPSEQTFTGFCVTSSEDIVVGSTITGATSGATGVVVAIFESDGSAATPNDWVAVTKVAGGPFLNGEDLMGLTATGVDEELRPDAAATDASSVLLVNDNSLIDEGVDFADGLVNDTIRNEWPVAATVSFPLSDLTAGVTTVNSWTLRVRARVIRKGDATFRSNTQYAPAPESDDTTTYDFTFAPGGGDTQTVSFTDVDAGMGFITRTATQAVAAATPAQINAALVDMVQSAFSQEGDLFDGLSLEIDAIDVVTDVDGAITICSDPTLRAAPTGALEDEWLDLARDEYRQDITVVPGEGAVLAAWQLGSTVYAVRNNVGSTAAIMHNSSAAGWTTAGVTMAEYITFDTGLAAGASVQEGDTLTGATSGATATIHRIILNAGSVAWDGSGEGYLVLTGVAGGPFQNGELLESPAATTIATATSANIQYAFSPGGTWEFTNHNFFAGAGTLRAYGVNANDFAFEIDENGVVSPIILPSVGQASGTGEVTLEPDPPAGAPFLIEEHRNFLWLAFPGGRYVSSVVGEPLIFTGFLGSTEFGAGDEVTGLRSIVSNVLVVTTERETRGLFGSSYLDFELKLMAEKTGSRLYAAQKVDTVYALDDLGITSVARTDAFGDFVGSTISQLVQPIVDAQRDNMRFTDSTIVRRSNQYRVYFNDGSALVMYIPATGDFNRNRGGEQTRTGVQFGFLTYPFAVSRIWNTEDGDGTERTYFATADAGAGLGFVFEDQIGTSFDGDEISSYVRTVFNQVGTPSYRKRFRRADLEINAQRPLSLKFVADLTFSAAEASSAISDLTVMSIPQIDIFAGGGFWDVDNWDEFFWDGQAISTARANLRGTGENVGFLIFNESKTAEPFILQGITLHYDLRRLQR